MSTTKRAPKINAQGFPKLDLPIQPPYPPMEAKRVDKMPTGETWQFEPKWDGFRAIVFRDGDEVQFSRRRDSRSARYFPEVVEAFRAVTTKQFVLDGEIVVPVDGRLSFDDCCSASIRPSRAFETGGGDAGASTSRSICCARKASRLRQPIEERREKLEAFFETVGRSLLHLSPATTDRKVARDWFNKFGGVGLDGVMAKRLGEPYHSGDREGMVKVKHLKTADCVVGGFRYGEGTKAVGSLLLGLYDDEGRLVYIGHTRRSRKTIARR